MPFIFPEPVGISTVHAVAVGLVLIAITVPLALSFAEREGQRWLAKLIMASLLLHLLGSVLQVVVVRVAYNNVADFNLYAGEGSLLAETWRSGTLSLAGLDLAIPGTGMMSVITGAVYFVIGTDLLGGFFVFTWFSLLGLLAFYRAFRILVPTGDSKKYAAILFLLPSLFYWPSATGKEAVMMPSLGLMTLGMAHLFKNQWSGVIPLLAGSVVGGLVRPHEVAMIFGSFAVAMLTRRAVRHTLVTPLRWTATFLIVGLVGGGLLLVTANFLGVSSFSTSVLVDTLTDTNEALQGGNQQEGFGSSYVWNPSPLYYPLDIYYVLFKPLPFEVASATQAFAALENLTIIALIAASWRSLVSVPRMLRESPYVVMCVVYSAGFIYLFSALGNVGLLARERTLLFPLLFVLLSLPARRDALDLSQADGAELNVRAAPSVRRQEPLRAASRSLVYGQTAGDS